jgi:hypothetical protein
VKATEETWEFKPGEDEDGHPVFRVICDRPRVQDNDPYDDGLRAIVYNDEDDVEEQGARGLGDVRLIAAAPDLYRALVAMENTECRCPATIIPSHKPCPHTLMRIALRKARGEP